MVFELLTHFAACWVCGAFPEMCFPPVAVQAVIPDKELPGWCSQRVTGADRSFFPSFALAYLGLLISPNVAALG